VLGPFAAVVLTKVLRRRARRRAPDPVDRVVGGWDEYVDAAVDRGLPPPRTRTRQEIAALYDADAAGAAATLATLADRSVFAAPGTAEADDETFWRLVEAERARLVADLGWWGRLRARISLRSLRPGSAGGGRHGRR
jgi:hypothetical protein